MGSSFSRPQGENFPAGVFYHAASDQFYTMYELDGRFFQRRHQLDSAGREVNVIEKEVHFVLGSGNHARTYLHQTPAGHLVQLPAGWYAENGGFWGMNPGYDRSDHFNFRRKIDQECFFCHNAYPQFEKQPAADSRELVLKGPVPEGIDCQRCHGPGRAHSEAARAAQPSAIIKTAILNPARLSRVRQLEVCFQCHLESTSRLLPYSIRRYGRGFFSYRPGEPLENYILHFDRAVDTAADDRFEIAHAAYRLMKSACFQKSDSLTCTTCHNPHEALHGEAGVRHYLLACQRCHAQAHRRSENCLECHMPKRRTDDVVHVVMTDHAIQARQPDRDLLAPLAEVHDTSQTQYRGEVKLLYPWTANTGLEPYLALAQVIDGANLAGGIPRLLRAVKSQPQAEFLFELANAYQKANRNGEAIAWYEAGLRRNPSSVVGKRDYAVALTAAGRVSSAIQVLESVTQPDAVTLNQLGSAYVGSGQLGKAIATLRRALILDPDLPETHVNLGSALFRIGDARGATGALRSAIRLNPGSAEAHSNLGNVVAHTDGFNPARIHFETAIRLQPGLALAHFNYGRALVDRKLWVEAESRLAVAVKLDPGLAEAAVSYGLVLARRGELNRAIEQYRRAIHLRPNFAEARFNLALALARLGKAESALQDFRAVVASHPDDHEAHFHLGKLLVSRGNIDAAVKHFQKAAETARPELKAAALKELRALAMPQGR
jgi:tetratricopeptide (TPR) repeat protein